MDNELTNLLPLERQRALSRDYIFRLGTVIVIVVTVLMFAAGLLLVPTYVLLTQSATAKQAHLASIQSTLSSSDEVALSERLAALSRDAAILAALGGTPSASAILRTALTVSHQGVTLSSFSYTPAQGGASGSLAISGIAATRDALRTYQLALESNPFASAANVPVSAYAKDADISFAITVTLAP